MQHVPNSVGSKNYPGDLLEHLRSFAALVASARSPGRAPYERAARQLGVDQSVLRRRIATLGEWLGGSLIYGRGAGLTVTARGERLVVEATELIGRADRLCDAIGRARPRIVVACTETITSSLLPRVLSTLDRRADAPIVTVRRLGSEACCRAIAAREVDLGVVRGHDAPTGVGSLKLCRDRLWVAIPRRHPLARGPLTRDRLARAPLILFSESSHTRSRVMAELAPLGAQIRVEIDGRAAALDFVRRGLGISFLSLVPGDSVAVAGVVARDASRLFAASSFWLAWHGGGYTAPVGQVVAALRGELAA